MREIKELRSRINDIDEQIIAALTARLETAEKIGRLKTKHNAAIYDPQREIQILDKVKSLAQKTGLERSEIKQSTKFLSGFTCRKDRSPLS